jgi:hypothetical protein
MEIIMTPEQKAKAYDEALKLASAAHKDEDKHLKATLERIFPELKENEDERIRKLLISGMKHLTYTAETFASIPIKDVIDWLEKQGEQDNSNVKDYNSIDPHFGKSIDKIEPKFHEGEWITNGDYTWKIVEIKPLDYILQSQDGNIVDDTISHIDEQFHSFTIEDAKDGDVLTNGKMVVIFKHFEEPSYRQHIVAYIGLDRGGNIQITDDTWRLGIDKAKPATKEQRDLLFQKMKEVGYEWDAEKKELKKIGQKSAWSEEDNYYRNHIIQIIEEINNAPLKRRENWEAYINWLKSLKQRIQGKKELKVGMRVRFNCFDGSEIIVKITRIENDTVYGISDIGSYHWCNIKDVELL